MNNVFTAADAKKAVEEFESLQGELFKKVTAKILKEVEDAARLGKRSLYIDHLVNFTNREAIKKQLEQLGYTFSHYSGRGMGDGDTTTVSW